MSMAAKIIRLSEKLKTIRSIIITEMERIIVSDKELLVSYNRNQLFVGKDANDKSLGIYAPSTIKQKKRKGRYYNEQIRLLDKGDFYESLFTELKNEILTFDNKDPDEDKTKHLERRFGDDIYGLSESDLNDYINNHLKPQLKIAVERILW